MKPEATRTFVLSASWLVFEQVSIYEQEQKGARAALVVVAVVDFAFSSASYYSEFTTQSFASIMIKGLLNQNVSLCSLA